MAPILLVACLYALPAPPATAAPAKSCRAKPHTLARDSGARVWRVGRVLWACVKLDAAPRTHRMGAWAPGTQVFLNGFTLAWTTPHRSGGVRSDRIWAGNVYTGERTMTNLPLVPASGPLPPRDARLQTLVGFGNAALAWVTQSRDVVMALTDPQAAPTPAGALPAPLLPDRQRLLVARYSSVDPFVLGASLHLFVLGGDGDECDTVSDYAVTFVDDANHATGAVWSGDAQNPQCQER